MSESTEPLPHTDPWPEAEDGRLCAFFQALMDKLDQSGSSTQDEVPALFAAATGVACDALPAGLLDRARQLSLDVQRLYEVAGSVRRCADSSWAEGREGDMDPERRGDDTTLPNPFPDEFRIVRKLGHGAFGEVWLADDLNLGRCVALKTLRHRVAVLDASGFLESLRKEAQLLACVQHPNVVQIYAWRQCQAEAYLVLQYVEGGTLRARLSNDGAMPWDQAARYIADVSDGLLEVHAKGIVHRDVKPSNILWDPLKDEALLTDFGISARTVEAPGFGGTPYYMAPEVFRGQTSFASDVYSLAASLFHLISGEIPFPAPKWEDQVALILQGLPPFDARFRNVPEPLERVIRGGLEADDTRRLTLAQFATGVRSALNQLLADSLAFAPGAAEPSAWVNLRLSVSRLEPDGVYRLVAADRPKPPVVLRNMKKVPRQPEQMTLRTRDHVRVELVADRDGYATVFNIGPTGDLNLLFPDDPAAAAGRSSSRTHRRWTTTDGKRSWTAGFRGSAGPVGSEKRRLPSTRSSSCTAKRRRTLPARGGDRSVGASGQGLLGGVLERDENGQGLDDSRDSGRTARVPRLGSLARSRAAGPVRLAPDGVHVLV
jgi:serine/threonine protein kinase